MKRLSLPKSPVRGPDPRASARIAPETVAPHPRNKAGSRPKRRASAAHDLPPAPVDDDDGPRDADEFRRDLARRISRFIADRSHAWRGCRERGCRRGRRCTAPHGICSEAKPPKPMTPAEEARHRAELRRLIRERIAADRAGP